jgi:flagellin-like protein
MEPRKLFTDERGVSPVVGVALLIAIAVILAAVIGAVVLGLGTGGPDTPQAQLNADFNTDGTTNSMTIRHDGGDPVPADEVVFTVNGTEDSTAELSSDLSAGESQDITFDATNHDLNNSEVALVWEDPNSDSRTVIERFEEDS